MNFLLMSCVAWAAFGAEAGRDVPPARIREVYETVDARTATVSPSRPRARSTRTRSCRTTTAFTSPIRTWSTRRRRTATSPTARTAPAKDEWSGDAGVGAMYFSQQAVDHLARGFGGSIILETAKMGLEAVDPALAEEIEIFMPDEKARRLGQSVAAAQIPVIG